MKTNLVLHCGAGAVERGQIVSVKTPEPTETWFPIPHETFIDTVQGALRNIGLEITNEAHSLTRDGNRYFGLMQVSRQGDRAAMGKEDYSYVLGLRNSHDKSFPAGLAVGSQVFVCDNLAFNGEIKIARRHTRFILDDLPLLAGRAVGLLVDRWHTMGERIDTYKQVELGDARVHDIVIRSLDAGACTGRQIPAILQQWREPNHPEFAPRNAWSLFNAYTEVAKTGSLAELPKRTTILHGLMDAECGLRTKEETLLDGVADAEVSVAE